MTKKNTFRTIFALLAIVTLSFTFISCGDDDDNISKESIIGKWYYEKEIVNGVEEINEEFDCETKKDYMEFLANGTIKFVNYSEDCKENVEGDETWKLSGKKIIITDKSETGTNMAILSIKKLTQNSLVVHLDRLLVNGKEQERDDDVTTHLKKLQ